MREILIDGLTVQFCVGGIAVLAKLLEQLREGGGCVVN